MERKSDRRGEARARSDEQEKIRKSLPHSLYQRSANRGVPGCKSGVDWK